MKILEQSPLYRYAPLLVELFDDFLWYISPHLWTTTTAGGGSPSVAISTNGNEVVLTTSSTIDNEAMVATTKVPFVPAKNKPMVFEALLQFTEASTNNQQLFAGFSDSFATGLFQASKAGFKASSSSLGIIKKAGETVYSTCSAVAGAATIAKGQISSGTSTYQKLRIEVQPTDGTNATVTYYVNDVPLKDTNNNPIVDTVAYGSLAQMGVGVYERNGAAASEVTNVDYVYAAYTRARP